LALDQGAADCVQGDAVGFGVECGDESGHFDAGLLAQEVQDPGAVFARTPGDGDASHVTVRQRTECVGNPRLFGGREITSYRHAC